MAFMLLKLLFWSLTSLANLSSFLLFRCIAILIVLTKRFMLPAQAIDTALRLAAELIRATIKLAADLAQDAVSSLVSKAFDLLVSAAGGSVRAMASAAAELVNRAAMMMREGAEILPELFEGTANMAGKVMEDLWINYKDAVGYAMGA